MHQRPCSSSRSLCSATRTTESGCGGSSTGPAPSCWSSIRCSWPRSGSGDCRSRRRTARNPTRAQGLRMYTENVGCWTRRVVGMVALVTFAALPGSGVACALVCASPSESTASATSGSASHAHHRAVSDAGHDRPSGHALLRVSGPPGHACGDHASIRQWPAEVTTLNAYHHGFLVVDVSAASLATTTAPIAHRTSADHGSPPGPPGTRTFVLRL